MTREIRLELKGTPRATENRIMTTETTTPVRLPRRARRSRLAVLAALVGVAVLALGACSPEEDRAIELVNADRSRAGLPTLPTNIDLYLKAQAWSSRLAGEQRLFHSYLPDGIGYPWNRLGENVGYGYSIEQVHGAFMGSPGHRANILDGGFNRIGVGVTRDGAGRYWVVQEFMQERL
jgi:uncharacterized protein YkwD